MGGMDMTGLRIIPSGMGLVIPMRMPWLPMEFAFVSSVMAKHPTIGVGAVADARGEISIFDGKLVISYGKTGASTDANSEYAALLATASATGWQSIRVEQDVASESVESYIAATAKNHGIDIENSFPFEVRGNIGPYVMHVNATPTGGPHGMGSPMAITLENKGDEIDGLVTGLYVATDLVGIATHGGERTHAHWVSLDARSTAHLDRWGLEAGTYLLLPKRD
jgi:acetolactate decarboxylase